MPAVFISYSRRDKAFVERLHDALKARDYDVWVDWEDIPPSAEWFAEIQAGVREADGFVYVISPDSVSSEVCRRELDNAVDQHKRIVPVVFRDPGDGGVPDAAAALNWVFLRSGDDFDGGLQRLTGALETDLEHVRVHTRLGVEASRWQDAGRDRSLLLRGSELAAAEAWLAAGAGKRPEATTLQREYLLVSRQATARRQRATLAAVSFALLVAIVLSVVALLQRSTAIRERNVAIARQLDANAQSQYDSDPELSVLLAARAARIEPGSQSQRILRTALSRSEVRLRYQLGAGAGGDVLWSPDGRRLLITSPGHWSRIYTAGDRVVIGGARAAVYDAANGRPLRSLPDGVIHAALSADGQRAVTVDVHAIGHVFPVAGGAPLVTFHPRQRSAARALARSAARPGTLVYATTGNGGPVTTFPGAATAAVFGPSSTFPELAYATLSDDIVHVFQFFSGRSYELTGATDVVHWLAFNPGGADLLATGNDGTIRIYDPGLSDTPIETLAGHSAPVGQASFGAGDTYVASSSDDGTARLWQGPVPLPSGQRVDQPGGDGAATTLAFSPGGQRIVQTGGATESGAGRILSARTLATLARFSAPAGHVFAGARWVRPAGPIITLSGALGRAGVSATEAESFDPAGGRLLATARPTVGSAFYGLSVDHSGTRALGLEAGGAAELFSILTGRPRHTLQGLATPAGVSAFAPRGGLVAVAHYPALPAAVDFRTVFGHVSIQLWDADSGRLIRTITAATLQPQVGGTRIYAPLSLAFSPNGRLLALAGANETVEVFDSATGRPATPPLSLAGGALGPFADSVAFSPDGSLLAAGAAEGAYLWHVPGFVKLPVFQHGPGPATVVGGVLGVRAAFSSDSRTLLTIGEVTAETWNIADHVRLLRAYPAGTGDLDRAATRIIIGNGGGVTVYPCTLCGGIPQLLQTAAHQLTRGFTPFERGQYLNLG